MDSEWNPYQPPETPVPQDAGFDVSRFGRASRRGAVELKKTLEERAGQGWCLVTSFSVSPSDPSYLIWRRTDSNVATHDVTPQYRILSLPGFMQCLRQGSFSLWSPAIAEQMAHLEPDWMFVAFCSTVGFVLRHKTPSEQSDSGPAEYSVLRRLPVAWRTMFGNSWMRVLADDLNHRPQPEAKVVSYLGGDIFLMRTNRAGVQSGSSDDRRKSCSYRLAMWPHWKRILFSGTPTIAPWFTEQAAEGWALLSHYQGAVFVFESTT